MAFSLKTENMSSVFCDGTERNSSEKTALSKFAIFSGNIEETCYKSQNADVIPFERLPFQEDLFGEMSTKSFDMFSPILMCKCISNLD